MKPHSGQAEAIVEYLPFPLIRWGLQGTERRLGAFMEGKAPPITKPITKHYQWCLTRPDAQTLSSCTINATTGDLEDAAYRRLRVVRNYNYDKIFAAIQLLRNRSTNDGMTLVEAAEGLRDVGVVPPNFGYKEVPGDQGSVISALEESSLICGLDVHPGYRPSRLHPVNGHIDVTGMTEKTGTYGHAMRLMGVHLLEHGPVYGLRQSWGSVGQFGDGLICVPVEAFHLSQLCDPIRFYYDEEWDEWDCSEWLL